MDTQALEALFKMQGWKMDQALIDDLFRDVPLYEIGTERDGSDYVDLRVQLEGMPGRPPCDRKMVIVWRHHAVIKFGSEFGISRRDGGFTWSRSARQITDWGIMNQL